jgi:hypothetical protein
MQTKVLNYSFGYSLIRHSQMVNLLRYYLKRVSAVDFTDQIEESQWIKYIYSGLLGLPDTQRIEKESHFQL